MHEFILIGLIGGGLSLIASAIVYEILTITWNFLPRISLGRLRIALVVAVMFIAHIISIWVFAIAFYLLAHHTDIGWFAGPSFEDGHYGTDLFSMVYYSTITYTSAGYGDIVGIRGFRFLSGIEALTGLILIGWTVSYLFLAMLRFWKHADKE